MPKDRAREPSKVGFKMVTFVGYRQSRMVLLVGSRSRCWVTELASVGLVAPLARMAGRALGQLVHDEHGISTENVTWPGSASKNVT